MYEVLNKLASKIKEKRKSKNLFWKSLFSIKDLICKVYDTNIKDPIETRKTIKDYDYLFRTIYANQKNEWLNYINPILEKIKSKKHSARILEVGCGIGYLLCQLAEMGFKVSGIDFSKKAIEHIPNKNIDVVCGNSKNLPWKSNYFDFVCSMGALEHYTYDVFDLLETFKEIHRVLKPGGIFAFFIPCYENSNKWNAIYKSGYHRNTNQYELGWSWIMWKRCVGNLFDWQIEAVKKIKYEWMHKNYIYVYATYRKTKKILQKRN